MWQYIVRRIFISILLLFVFSLLLYTLIRNMPGDYVSVMTAGKKNVSEEMITNLRRIYGLDTGIFQGYLNWVKNAVTGNFGESFYYNRPVSEIIPGRMMVSFSFALPVLLLEVLIGIPLGIFSATRPYSASDYAVTTLAFVGISVPGFFLATILKRVFAYGLGWFPPFGLVDARQGYSGFMLFLDKAHHLVLPVLTLTLLGIGAFMRYARSSMLDVMNSDYIRTARAKGLSERRVVYHHGLRNTMIPIVTIIGSALPFLFAGAIITEQIFAIPGIGKMGLDALQNNDIPLIMAFNLIVAALTLAGSLLADISYAFVDPRVRLG